MLEWNENTVNRQKSPINRENDDIAAGSIHPIPHRQWIFNKKSKNHPMALPHSIFSHFL
jgi:hypothetical protein